MNTLNQVTELNLNIKVKKPIIIHGLARSGTTWLYKYVERYNIKNFKTHFIDSNSPAGREFFALDGKEFLFYDDTAILRKQKYLNSNIAKINFLSQERKKGREYSYKAKTNHVRGMESWFEQFYKDWHIIKILRRNKWDQFVSWVVQDKNNWDHRFDYIDPIFISNNDIDTFLSLLSTDVEVYDDCWHYEDLTTEFLQNYFEVSVKENTNEVLTRKSSYKQIIQNYNEAKIMFDKTIKNAKINYD